MSNDVAATLSVLLAFVLVAQVVQIVLSSAHNRRLAKEIQGVKLVQQARYALQVRRQREARQAETLVPDVLRWLQAQASAGLPDAVLSRIDSPRVDAELRSVELLTAEGTRLVVSPYNAAELRRLERQRLHHTPRVIRASAHAPLLNGVTGVVSAERSLLNAGDYFDLEMAQAGRMLKVPGWDEFDRLYFHVRVPNGNRAIRR